MKILATTVYGIIVLSLLLIGGVFVASIVPVPGHLSIKIVKSGSMEPAIHVGSIVVIQPRDTYVMGDVITFGADTKIQIPTTHRIVEIGDDHGTTIFTTKGDANEDPDGTRTKLSEVHGKVLFTVPYAGYVLDFAKKPLGFGLMIALPAGIIILDEIIRIISELQKIKAAKYIAQRRKEEDEQPETDVVTVEELRKEVSAPQRTKNIDGIMVYHYE
jgi:signal peptidase